MPTSRRVGERLTRPRDPVALGAAGSCHVRTREAMHGTMAVMRIPSLILVGCLLASAVALVACGSTASPPPTTAPTSSLVPPITGQTDTEWGRIWDTLPADFPIYPGATPSDEAAEGPASATLVVDGDVAGEVATWMTEQLRLDAYAVDGMNESLEDGSYVVEATREAGCRVQVTATPTGSLTTVTILYGTSCPNT